jgi:ATP-dependent Clp protease protease subunit
MGALLFAAGEAGKRFILPNGRILLHQPLISGVMQGTATDLEIEAKEILRLRSRLYKIFSEHTGKDAADIEKDCDRNLWLEADEAVSYGLADKIMKKAPEVIS